METMKYLLHLLLVCRWWQEDLSMFTILMIGHLESFFVPGKTDRRDTASGPAFCTVRMVTHRLTIHVPCTPNGRDHPSFTTQWDLLLSHQILTDTLSSRGTTRESQLSYKDPKVSTFVLSTGLAGIQPVQLRGIENVDATEYVEGHSSYLWMTKEILRQIDVDNYNAIFRTTQQAKPLQDQTKQANIVFI
ncbi:hypothetical protein Gotur_007657 [Gossypium turneri]